MIAELMLVLIDYKPSVIQRPSIPNHDGNDMDKIMSACVNADFFLKSKKIWRMDSIGRYRMNRSPRAKKNKARINDKKRLSPVCTTSSHVVIIGLP